MLICYTPRMRALTSLLSAVIVAALLCAAAAAQTAATASKTPEIIFYNGTIYTGEGLAQDKPRVVEAMAVGGGKVLAVGRNAEVKRLAGPQTRLLDLKARGTSLFVFPGFNGLLPFKLARPPAIGSRAPAGTTPCGPTKHCPHGRIWTR